MTTTQILKELKSFGNKDTKKVLVKHGAREPFYGVRVQDLKKIMKKIKKDHELSIELFATGNSDAMYLAGLIADEDKITKKDLRRWAYVIVQQRSYNFLSIKDSHCFRI